MGTQELADSHLPTFGHGYFNRVTSPMRNPCFSHRPTKISCRRHRPETFLHPDETVLALWRKRPETVAR
jgi:hypothetical protein